MEKSGSETPKRAAIYCRISQDREGAGDGVDRQRDDSVDLAERLGYEVSEIFEENDTSAFTRRVVRLPDGSSAQRVVRPQFRRMLDFLAAGKADVLVAYDLDRIARDPRDLEDLIDLVESRHLSTVTCTGNLDLSSDNGIAMARVMVAMGNKSSRDTARRVKRAKEQAAAQGKYRGGPRPFGYESDGITVVAAEAEIVAKATTDLLAGRSLNALAREWNEAGVKTTSKKGKPWTPSSLRDVLMRPRNAGLLHTGRRPEIKIVGKAAWPAIVDEDAWRAAFELLREPSRRTSFSNESKWLGTSIYQCQCGETMRASVLGGTPSGPNRNKQAHYRCKNTGKGHVTIRADYTDDYVRDVTAEIVADPRTAASLNRDDASGMKSDRDRRQKIRTSIEQTERDYDEDMIDAKRYRAKTDRLKKELAEIDERLASGTEASVVSPIFNADEPREAFLSAPLDVQRAVVRAVLSVEILPSAGRGRVWSPERISISRQT